MLHDLGWPKNSYKKENGGDCVPRLVRVFEFELWNRNGGNVGTIRGVAPTIKEARAIVKAVPHGWIVRNGKQLQDCYANAQSLPPADTTEKR